MRAEEEYRLVYFPVNNENMKIRIKDELLIPYIEYHDEIRSSIVSITMSPQNNNELSRIGIAYLLSKFQLPVALVEKNEMAEKKQNIISILKSSITLRY